MRKKREKEEVKEPSAPFWLVTYGDMVTLLLAFFILLISFSSLDEKKFGEAAKSLKGALGILKRHESILDNKKFKFEEENILDKMEIYENIQELERTTKELGLDEVISIKFTETGLLIQMGDKVLFDLGKADLRSKAFPILNIVGKTIRSRAREVLVSGHTDNIPIDTKEFPSNWELSSARATSVVKYLIDFANVPAEILAATGYSEFRPLLPNDSPENRQKNRRVEFLVTWR